MKKNIFYSGALLFIFLTIFSTPFYTINASTIPSTTSATTYYYNDGSFLVTSITVNDSNRSSGTKSLSVTLSCDKNGNLS